MGLDTEKAAVGLVDVQLLGRTVRLTLRADDDATLWQRIQGWVRLEAAADDSPAPVSAPKASRPTAGTPSVPPPAAGDGWCAYHEEAMRKTGQGKLAHKVGEKLWCEGHWCEEHDARFWENISQKTGAVYFSHKRADGGRCYERPVKAGAGAAVEDDLPF